MIIRVYKSHAFSQIIPGLKAHTVAAGWSPAGTTMPALKATRCYWFAISGVNWPCNQWLILNDLRRDPEEEEWRHQVSIWKKKIEISMWTSLIKSVLLLIIWSRVRRYGWESEWFSFLSALFLTKKKKNSTVLLSFSDNVLLIISSWLACLRGWELCPGSLMRICDAPKRLLKWPPGELQGGFQGGLELWCARVWRGRLHAALHRSVSSTAALLAGGAPASTTNDWSAGWLINSPDGVPALRLWG